MGVLVTILQYYAAVPRECSYCLPPIADGKCYSIQLRVSRTVSNFRIFYITSTCICDQTCNYISNSIRFYTCYTYLHLSIFFPIYSQYRVVNEVAPDHHPRLTGYAIHGSAFHRGNYLEIRSCNSDISTFSFVLSRLPSFLLIYFFLNTFCLPLLHLLFSYLFPLTVIALHHHLCPLYSRLILRLFFLPTSTHPSHLRLFPSIHPHHFCHPYIIPVLYKLFFITNRYGHPLQPHRFSTTKSPVLHRAIRYNDVPQTSS